MSQMDLPRLDRNRGAVQAAGLYWMEEGRMKALGTQMNFCEWEKNPASSRGPTNHFTVFHGKMSLINNSLNNYIYM